MGVISLTQLDIELFHWAATQEYKAYVSLEGDSSETLHGSYQVVWCYNIVLKRLMNQKPFMVMFALPKHDQIFV